MTIGDEKVVAWMIEIDGVGKTLTFSGTVVASYEAQGCKPTPLIPQSAYAELAAERDLVQAHLNLAEAERDEWKRRALNKAAESQLAELRGSLAALADRVQRYDHQFAQNVANELRTLAAADGGGK